MEPDAPVMVLKGFFATCSAGALVGATYGIIKRQPPVICALNSSLNSGLVGLTFFVLREYVTSPVLVQTVPWGAYPSRRQSLDTHGVALEAAASSSSPPSHRMAFSEMRSHKLLDTGIAGGATGGILNCWKRGLPGVIPGFVTAGLLCTAAQLLWNELGVGRVKYVSWATSQRHPQDSGTPPPPPARERTLSEKILDGLGMVLPVKKIPDDVYMQRLLREREAVEKRLEEVRHQLREAEEDKES